ncbi:CaiB/BaiF CoA transferase family protein [Nocardioides plantarum]|uniref:CaiB/BaiF CoA transferase family protein n=1 Tax=Nocardioides plantarum TaxID=29299 RepID=A0ABV5KDK6_9ACTN|nr:CoA transferase [Nocardioides plantarum]
MSDTTNSHDHQPDQQRDQHANGPRGPLDGLVVADFSRVLAGPYATMLLADMGATVIKVEGPGGDDTRHWMPPTRDEVSTYYLSINRNKRSITLDLKDPDDAAVARRLADRADVVIENFKPGGLDKYQLDYDSVAASNPKVIYTSISGFGTGGGAHLPGYDLMVQAMSGLMSLTGSPDGPPYRAGISVFDVMTGMHALIGTLAALNERHQSGRGQHIEVNLLSSALSGLVNHTGAYAAAGAVPHRMGNAHPSLFPYEPLETADGEMVIIAGNDRQFAALAKVLGRPELADDPRYATVADRTENRDALKPVLEALLKEHTRAEWFDLLTGAGLPAGPINTVQEGVEFAASLGLEPVVEVGTGTTAVPLVRNPIGFSRSSLRYDLPPPTLGADSDHVRSWINDNTGEFA